MVATLVFFYEVLALIISVAALVLFVRGLYGVPLPPEARSSRKGSVPGLSVVLVLDHEVDPRHSVDTLLAQTYPQLELIVVLCGARLEKATREALEADPRVKLVPMGDLPPGWTRRNYAAWVGYRSAQHDHFLFIDGLVVLRSDGIERSMIMAQQRGADLLTLFPGMTATSWWERLMVPFLLQLTLVGMSPAKINDPEHDAAGGFVPFFLFRRAVYEGVGGHSAVRAERFGESVLAHRVKAAGYRLLVGHGVDLVVLQGQDSFREIWSSWSRSLSAAIGNDRRQAALAALLVTAVFATPWLLFVVAILGVALWSPSIAESPWLGAVLMGGVNVMMGILHRRMLRTGLGVDDSLALLQPLAALVTAAMIVVSPFHLEGSRLGRLARAMVRNRSDAGALASAPAEPPHRRLRRSAPSSPSANRMPAGRPRTGQPRLRSGAAGR